MSITIKEEMYKDIECIVLENDSIRVVTIPKSGGKIQSIFDKNSNFEYLYQSPNKKFKIPYYGAKYEDGDFSGFDDMFPNISLSYYHEFPWNGIELPDHGEIWSQQFEYFVENEAVVLKCSGVRIPYTFEKRITLGDGNKVEINYSVKNDSSYGFKFIWAAHPLINIDENSEILLPSEAENIIHTFAGFNAPSVFGETGNINYDNSYTKMSAGLNMCKKYYLYGAMSKGESALYNNKTKRYLKFNYPVEKVPYLGIWINNNGYFEQRNVAIEPCTGALDAIDIADKYGWCSKVEAKESYNWYLNIDLGHEADKRKVIE